MTGAVAKLRDWLPIVSLALMLLGVFASVESAEAWTLKVIHSFCNADRQCPDGRYSGKLIEDDSGDLFGALNEGGQYDFGSVFELVPNANRSQWTFKTVYSFCADQPCTDGAYPSGNLIRDTAGNLYGTAEGGAGGSGVIFRISQSGKYDVLYALCYGLVPCYDGVLPFGLTYVGAAQGVPYDGKSPLYGMADGGAYQYGAVFMLREGRHDTWSYTVLHAFCRANVTNCPDGQLPIALAPHPSGGVFGITFNGGKRHGGVLFRLTRMAKHRWNDLTLYDFCRTKGCPQAGFPVDLVIAADGSLVGSATRFGPHCVHLHIGHGCGAIFQIQPDGSQYYVLHGFCEQQKCLDGRAPGSLLEVQPGDFFGVTGGGGAADSGTVFELRDGSFQSLYQFCRLKDCQDGKWPVTGLTADPSGSFFGTTSAGGAYGYGEVFELSP